MRAAFAQCEEWGEIAEGVNSGRAEGEAAVTGVQCLRRYDQLALRSGPFTAAEDTAIAQRVRQWAATKQKVRAAQWDELADELQRAVGEVKERWAEIDR